MYHFYSTNCLLQLTVQKLMSIGWFSFFITICDVAFRLREKSNQNRKVKYEKKIIFNFSLIKWEMQLLFIWPIYLHPRSFKKRMNRLKQINTNCMDIGPWIGPSIKVSEWRETFQFIGIEHNKNLDFDLYWFSLISNPFNLFEM